VNLSEKGFERRSERRIGQYIGAKIGRTVRCRCSVQLRFGCLQDFSDSFVTEFYEVRTRRSLERFLHYFARHSSSLRSHYAPLVGYGLPRSGVVHKCALIGYLTKFHKALSGGAFIEVEEVETVLIRLRH
jgi:hypothetical protein